MGLSHGFHGKRASIKKNCRLGFLFLKKHWTKFATPEIDNLEQAMTEFLDEK